MPTLSFGGGSHIGRGEREEGKQVQIYTQKDLEYLEGGNQVSPKSLPLQGIKAQSLRSLFIGEVTHASYQPCS